MIDVSNDSVAIFQDLLGQWRWHRVDNDNGKIVAISGQGYSSESYAIEAARAYNVGAEVLVTDQ